MFGQIIIGLANSGKSTYCKTMKNFLKSQNRKIKMINLDPGAENLPYKSDVDIRDLICIDQIMQQTNYGPNESLTYAMEFLLTNIEWLEKEFSKLSNDSYLIIDLPGQIELYSHNTTVPKIISHFTNPKTFNYRLTAVFLAESIYCQTPEAYISILMTTLSSMLQLALPQVNILSKSSLMSEKSLQFDVESYLEVKNLEYLVDCIPGKENGKKKKMYRQMVDIIVDLPWLSFSLFDSKNEESIKEVVSQVDLANGYVVKQQFMSLLDEKHSISEEKTDKDSDDLVNQLFP